MYNKTSPEAIWEAITKSQWTVQYGDAPLVVHELRSAAPFGLKRTRGCNGRLPKVISDGEVIEAESFRQQEVGPDVAHDDDARNGIPE